MDKTLSVLMEQNQEGLSTNYIRVSIPDAQENEIIETTLSKENLRVHKH